MLNNGSDTKLPFIIIIGYGQYFCSYDKIKDFDLGSNGKTGTGKNTQILG